MINYGLLNLTNVTELATLMSPEYRNVHITQKCPHSKIEMSSLHWFSTELALRKIERQTHTHTHTHTQKAGTSTVTRKVT